MESFVACRNVHKFVLIQTST